MSTAAAFNIDWSKQHCGVHQAPASVLCELMPDLVALMSSFPEDADQFTWDVKVHMLMPRQYPCIPGWHVDNVPREGGIQRYERSRVDLPMWMWVSGGPLTQFSHGYVQAQTWYRFTQVDQHRGQPASDFCWRGFVRGTHKDIQPPKKGNHLRRHCQVYVCEENYQW